MSNGKKMTPCRIERITREVEASQLPDLAAKHLDTSTAWLLAETPVEMVFQPLQEPLAGNVLAEAFSVIIFGPAAEIRFERQPGEKSGLVRILAQSDAGEPYLGISREVMFRDKKGTLEYMELFTESDSGFLRKAATSLFKVLGRNK